MENNIISDAIYWWETHRPLSFTLEQHLKNPTINTSSKAEEQLALSVARYLNGK